MYLGIDTGGTYTDAVIFDKKHGVISSAKALTTKNNLSDGIQGAVRAALPDPRPDIELVSLSSTLATNAIVEGQGNPICLFLIGYDARIMAEYDFGKLVPPERIVYIRGGHTVTGDEECPLDVAAARDAIVKYTPVVSAFAVSGYFSVRNPAHELKVKNMVRRLTDLPVTCGHELTTNLDAPVRAITVALNARLIPLMHRQITEVKKFLVENKIDAPLMVVKGDGSLIDSSVALERPVETILSGPAASVIGAMHLCKEKNAFVVDIGGTTTDVAGLVDGQPAVNHEGAKIGRWQTMVEALDVHTTGLGGDSEVHADKQGNITVGPRRVIPLSLLANDFPGTVVELQAQLNRAPGLYDGRFILRQRNPGAGQSHLSELQADIWNKIVDGPVSIARLMDGAASAVSVSYAMEDLVSAGLAIYGAFTPTDAVHVLGRYQHGSVEAAICGARQMVRNLDISRDEFCRRVVNQVVVQAGHIVLECALASEDGARPAAPDGMARTFIDRALRGENNSTVNVKLSINKSLIGLGAPAATYLPALADRLDTRLVVPTNAEVGNAVGAVAGGVMQTVRILIRKPSGLDNCFRAYLPTGVRDFLDSEDAVAYARRAACRLARNRARQAGAGRVKVFLSRNDLVLDTTDKDLNLGTEIIARAAGRPKPRERERVKR